MTIRLPLRAGVLGGAVLLMLGPAKPAGAEPELRFPVACEIGQTCFVQHHVDLDPSPAAADFQCGTLTYDGHNGTDIRLPTLRAQRDGVDVLAAADGRVLRTRDGVPDQSIRARGEAAARGSECGNGLIIDHGEGWETQYCHLAQGSIAVRPGDVVTAGQPVGRVGLSGETEFPHLHFIVRHGAEIVDPFAADRPAGACGGGRSLWAADGRRPTYRPGAILNTGFAPGPVTMEAIEEGEAGRAAPGADAPALVAFARAIGLKGGDVQRLILKSPSGEVLAETTAPPLDRNKAQVMLFAGKRRPQQGWPRGRYEATYTLTRDGRILLARSFDLSL